MTKMIAAPPNMTQSAASPLTSVAPTTTTSTPVKRNRGHQRVRRNRARRAALRRAGLLAGTAGRPSPPGTGGTAGLALSRRRDRRVIRSVQQLSGTPTRPRSGGFLRVPPRLNDCFLIRVPLPSGGAEPVVSGKEL